MNSSFRVGISPDFYTDAKGHFERVVEERLSSAGIVVCPLPEQENKIAQADVIDQFDAILSLALKYDARSFQGIQRLALIARWGVGYDMIDTRASSEAGVALAITPGAVKRPVAESVLAFVFALATNLTIQDRIVRSGGWRAHLPGLGLNIKGRVLGSLGLGNIAREVFRMSQSLGFYRMIAHDPFIDAAAARELNIEMVTMQELFEQSDFLSIHVPLSAETRGLVSAQLLRSMKSDAFLINTARGPIVDEAALCTALRERWIAGAGLDVFEQEPLPASSPLRGLDNVILTPHGLAWTAELARDNSIEACENILNMARGVVPAAIVNRDVLQNATFQAKVGRFRSRS